MGSSEAALRASSSGRTALGLAIAGVAVWMAVDGVGASGHDDAHITFFVADHLAEQGVIANYNGEAVEQSSSLGFVALLAAARTVTGLPVPLLGYVLGLVGLVLAIAFTQRLAERLVPRGGLFAAAIVATAWCVLHWSTTGMETTMAAAASPAVALAGARYLERSSIGRGALFAGTALAFASLRPENVIVAWCATLALGAWSWRMKQQRWAVAALLAGPALLLTAGRLVAFGAAFPHPVMAKVEGPTYQEGLSYLVEAATQTNAALLVAAALGAVLVTQQLGQRRAEPEEVLVMGLGMSQLAFVVLAGGDWMKAGRFLVPAIPLAAVLCVLASRGAARRWLPAVVLGSGLLSGAQALGAHRERALTFVDARQIAKAFPDLGHAFTLPELACSPHLRDAPLSLVLNRWLDRLADRIEGPIVIASGQAGLVPYRAVRHLPGRVHFLDQYALTSPELTECAPHTLRGAGRFGRQAFWTPMLAGELEAPCGLDRPAIVYSNRFTTEVRSALRKHGYATVYHQQGVPDGLSSKPSTALRGAIAIRRDLLTGAERTPHWFRWKEGEPILPAHLKE